MAGIKLSVARPLAPKTPVEGAVHRLILPRTAPGQAGHRCGLPAAIALPATAKIALSDRQSPGVDRSAAILQVWAMGSEADGPQLKIGAAGYSNHQCRDSAKTDFPASEKQSVERSMKQQSQSERV